MGSVPFERPNSMAWSQWLRLGALDETRWVTDQPAMWSSKVGRVRVDGVGRGLAAALIAIGFRGQNTNHIK